MKKDFDLLLKVASREIARLHSTSLSTLQARAGLLRLYKEKSPARKPRKRRKRKLNTKKVKIKLSFKGAKKFVKTLIDPPKAKIALRKLCQDYNKYTKKEI